MTNVTLLKKKHLHIMKILELLSLLILMFVVTDCNTTIKSPASLPTSAVAQSNGALLHTTPVGPNSGLAFLSDRDHLENPGSAEIYLMYPEENISRLSCSQYLEGPLRDEISDLSGHFTWSPLQMTFYYAHGNLQQIDLSDDAKNLVRVGPWHIDVSDSSAIMVAGMHNPVTGGDIAVIDLAGSNPITITDGLTRDALSLPLKSPFYAPAISADGRQVVFLSYGRLFVVDSNGRNPRQLTPDIRATWPVSWSPEGRQIVFPVIDDAQEGDSLKMLSLDTDILTDFIIDGSSPSWSPDGTMIAFTRSDDQIWIANTDGSNLRVITSKGKNCCPIWITEPDILLKNEKTTCEDNSKVVPQITVADRGVETTDSQSLGQTPTDMDYTISCSEVALIASHNNVKTMDKVPLAAINSYVDPGLLGTWCLGQTESDEVVIIDPSSVLSRAGSLVWLWGNGAEMATCPTKMDEEGVYQVYRVSFGDNGNQAFFETSEAGTSAESFSITRLVDFTTSGNIADDIIGRWSRGGVHADDYLEFHDNGHLTKYGEDQGMETIGTFKVKKALDAPGYQVSFKISRARFTLPLVMAGEVMALGDKCDNEVRQFNGVESVYGIFIRLH